MSISPPCYKQNRLKQLRAFCKAVETKSISKAGEELFLSQPTVSLQIRALERELCVQVFERRGPVINLTPDGEILYELAKPLIKEWLDANLPYLVERIVQQEIQRLVSRSDLL